MNLSEQRIWREGEQESEIQARANVLPSCARFVVATLLHLLNVVASQREWVPCLRRHSDASAVPP